MRYVLATLGILVLLIFAVVLFSRTTTDRNQTTQEGEKTIVLNDYANDKSKVEYQQYGSVVADENRRTMKIIVSENERTLMILDGYQETPSTTQTLDNNTEAYQVFLKALDNAGFTRKKDSSISDPVGVCPQGVSYAYLLLSDGNEVSKLWNNSCTSKDGTIGGNTSLIRSLFQDQIPNYSKLVQGVSF